jgi:hypothetical protein
MYFRRILQARSGCERPLHVRIHLQDETLSRKPSSIGHLLLELRMIVSACVEIVWLMILRSFVVVNDLIHLRRDLLSVTRDRGTASRAISFSAPRGHAATQVFAVDGQFPPPLYSGETRTAKESETPARPPYR